LQGVGVQPQDAAGGGKQRRRVDAELSQPIGQRHHLGRQKAEQQLPQPVPDPIGARLLFQQGGDIIVQGPHVQPRRPAVSRPCRLGPPLRRGQADDLPAGRLGRLALGGPGRAPQVDEGLLVIQPFQFLKRDLGLLNHVPSLQRDLELGGQPAAPLGPGGRPEQGRDQSGIGLQGTDLGRVPAPRGGRVHV
jgi:hypothetical protein